MGPVRCEVHTLLEDDPNKRVVRIRANAFQAFQGKKCIVQIRNIDKYAYFEAVYADDAYMKSWQAKNKNFRDNDLIFMSKSRRELLGVKPSESVDLEEIQGKGLQSLYAVHSALSDDSNEGRIWIKPSQNPELCREIKDRRRIVCIKRKDAEKGKDAKPVYSEALFADSYYLKNWEEKWKEKGIVLEDCNVIFISAWYRRLLGIENIGEIIDLSVKPQTLRNLPALLYQYPRNHPQALVLTASMMGIIGFGLGVIGIGLGIVGIKDLLATNILSPIGFGVCVAGFAVTLLGIIGLIRK